MRLAIIIPSYERARSLIQTIRKIARLRPQPDEVWLMEQSRVTNAAIQEACNEIKAQVHLIPHLLPNAQSARNRAALQAKAEILLFLDDDVDPEPDLVKAHLENYRDPSIQAVAGFYLEPGEQETSKARKTVWWRVLTSLEKYSASYSERVDSPLWPSCNGSIRREVFLKLRGFDENYRYTLLDDTDLASRMQKAGYRCVHDPKARLFHRKEPTGGSRPIKVGDRVIASREKWYTWFYFFWMNYGLWGIGEIFFRMRTNVCRKPYFQRPVLLVIAIKEIVFGFGQAVRSMVQGRKLMREDG